MRSDHGWAASPYLVFAAAAAVVLATGQLAAWLLPDTSAAVAGALAAAAVGAAAWWRLGQPALRRAETRGAGLLEAVADPLVILDREGVVLAANDPAVQRFGDGESLAGRPLLDRMPADEARAVAAQLREAVRNQRATRFAETLEGAHLRFSAVPMAPAEHDDAAMVLHVGDATAEKQCAALAAVARMLGEARLGDGEATGPLLARTCQQLAAALGARLVWIGRKLDGGAVGVVACAGQDMDADAELRRNPGRWDETGAGRSPVGGALRTGMVQVATIGEAGVQDWQKAARRFGLRAICAVPAAQSRDPSLVLVLAARRPEAFDDPRLIEGLQVMAAQIAAAAAAAADRERLARYEAVLAHVAEAAAITDRAGVFEWVNPAFTHITGYGADEVLGRTPRLLKSDRHDADLYRELWASILAGNTWSGELVNRRKDGTTYLARQTIVPLRDAAGAILRYLSVQEDVGELRALEERMRHMAQHDALTDLPNRALFLDRLGYGIAMARRNRQPLALLVVNLDHFGLVNDALGLSGGDRVLQEVAVRLRQAVRDSDTVARLAGDEFAVIAPQVLVRDDAGRVAEKLMDALKAPFVLEMQEVKVTASIGIALYPQDGENAEQLATRASSALKLVKMKDRNGYRFATAG